MLQGVLQAIQVAHRDRAVILLLVLAVFGQQAAEIRIERDDVGPRAARGAIARQERDRRDAALAAAARERAERDLRVGHHGLDRAAQAPISRAMTFGASKPCLPWGSRNWPRLGSFQTV